MRKKMVVIVGGVSIGGIVAAELARMGVEVINAPEEKKIVTSGTLECEFVSAIRPILTDGCKATNFLKRERDYPTLREGIRRNIIKRKR